MAVMKGETYSIVLCGMCVQLIVGKGSKPSRCIAKGGCVYIPARVVDCQVHCRVGMYEPKVQDQSGLHSTLLSQKKKKNPTQKKQEQKFKIDVRDKQRNSQYLL